jgi:hypothetical protein
MKAKIAVATVSGKSYFLVVNELKRRNVPFTSLTPFEHIPVGVEVVITTEEEQSLINHEKKLVYREGMDPRLLVSEALQITQGKESFEKITIGVDPGDVIGLAVLGDGKIIETENCYSVDETLRKIQNVLANFEKTQAAIVSVKIGDGVPALKERLLGALDKALPSYVVLESVSEAGTNRGLNESKHRRGLRDIVSAIRIAGRSGHIFQRRKENEENS